MSVAGMIALCYNLFRQKETSIRSEHKTKPYEVGSHRVSSRLCG